MSNKIFEMARDIRGVRSTVGRMVGQLYRQFDNLGLDAKESESQLREVNERLDHLDRRLEALEKRVAALNIENLERHVVALEGGRR